VSSKLIEKWYIYFFKKQATTMKKLFFLLIWIGIISPILGQNDPKIDSLEKLLPQAKTGIERLEILEELFLLHPSTPKREQYYRQAQQNFEEQKDDIAEAHLDFMKVKLAFDEKKYTPELAELANRVLAIYQKEKEEDKYIVRALSLIADMYKLNNQIKLAVEYNLKAIQKTEKSTTIPQKEKQEMMGFLYIKLANKTSLLKDPKSIKYSTKGVRMLENTVSSERLVGIYGNHSIALRRANQYDSALVYAQKIYSILKNTGNNDKKAQLAYMIATIYIEMNKIDLAIKYAEESLTYFEENTKSEVKMSMSFYLLGKLYQQQKNNIKAIFYLEETIQIANKYNLLEMLHNAYIKLSEVYKAQNNTDKAYIYLSKAFIYGDSVNTKRREKETKELVQKYETEKKEQQIKELEQQKIISDLENQNKIASLQAKISVLGLILLAPISLLIGGGWYVNRRRLTLKLEAEQKERAKQMSELKAIRSQMNPHFIFNALNSIQDFIMLSEKENAQHYLGKFATLMRGFLESSSKETISLDKELTLLESYIELEGLRLGEEFNYEVIFDEKIDEEELEDIEVPPLLIQPYLENAFKHGLLHKTGSKKLTLAFDKIEKDKLHFLQLKITDNGVGREKTMEINARKAKTHQSFATQATTERLELMKNQSLSNKSIEVQINDLKDEHQNAKGTEVVILIPIDNH